MKQQFRFKAFNNNGKIVFFTKQFNCPDFNIIPSKNWNGIKLPETSIESQLMDWLDNQNKSDLMNEKNLHIIIDYWIVKKKIDNYTIIDHLKQLNLSEQVVLDFIAVYKEIKPLLKHKSIKTQIEIVFSHMYVGYKAVTNTHDRILNILHDNTIQDKRKLLT